MGAGYLKAQWHKKPRYLQSAPAQPTSDNVPIVETRIVYIFIALISFCLAGSSNEPLGDQLQGTPKTLDQLYDRIAADLEQGRPLVATVYVALCDNDSQGIVPVKNRRICRGDEPEQNLYWATSGGLKGYLGKQRWQRVSYEREPSPDILVRAIWRKRFRPRGALARRGLRESFEVYVVGLAYRGERIHQANIDYLRAVNRDRDQVHYLSDGTRLEYGGGGQVVGYVGHNYFFDVGDPGQLLWETRGDSVEHKGVFALACAGESFIKPAIQRANTHILLLNRDLAFPGAWTVGGLIRGLAAGMTARGVHREAARSFAAGMGRPPGVMFATFAHGD